MNLVLLRLFSAEMCSVVVMISFDVDSNDKLITLNVWKSMYESCKIILIGVTLEGNIIESLLTNFHLVRAHRIDTQTESL